MNKFPALLFAVALLLGFSVFHGTQAAPTQADVCVPTTVIATVDANRVIDINVKNYYEIGEQVLVVLRFTDYAAENPVSRWGRIAGDSTFTVTSADNHYWLGVNNAGAYTVEIWNDEYNQLEAATTVIVN